MAEGIGALQTVGGSAYGGDPHLVARGAAAADVRRPQNPLGVFRTERAGAHGETLTRRPYVAFGTTSGNLFVSEDGGRSWLAISHHLPTIYAVRFA